MGNVRDMMSSYCVFACIGILGMGKIGIQNSVQVIDKILVIISGNSDFIYNKRIKQLGGRTKALMPL